jgi:hypothetical protein
LDTQLDREKYAADWNASVYRVSRARMPAKRLGGTMKDWGKSTDGEKEGERGEADVEGEVPLSVWDLRRRSKGITSHKTLVLLPFPPPFFSFSPLLRALFPT